jgi:hypothetical protein
MAIAFLVLGWLFVRTGVWLFPLFGAAVGCFAAIVRPDGPLLGSVAAAAGFVATLLAAGFPPAIGSVFVVAGCAIAGAVAALDDRLAGG